MNKKDEIIKEVVDKIATTFKPEKIIIFGSYAYGHPTEKSDVDILVIMNTGKREVKRMIAVSKLLREYNKKLDFDIIVKTPVEIKHLLDIRDPFICTIISKGRVGFAK